MKRLALTDFIWLREPLGHTRTRLSVDVTVAPHTPPPPHAALLLAVSDEYFTCELTLKCDRGLEGGMVLYHTDRTFIAVGLTEGEMAITSSVMGWLNRWHVPRSGPTDGQTIWTVDRSVEGVAIGYRTASDEAPTSLGRFTLPAMAKSVSFGPYFTNRGAGEPKALIERLSYRRSE